MFRLLSISFFFAQ